jgi:hypothetical protein
MSGAKGKVGILNEIKFLRYQDLVNRTPLCIRLNCVVMHWHFAECLGRYAWQG